MMMSVKDAGISEISAISGISGIRRTNTIPPHIFTALNIKIPTKFLAIQYSVSVFPNKEDQDGISVFSSSKTDDK